MQNQRIHILKMGGTIEFIDPAYDVINREALKLDTSIETFLQNVIKPHFTYTAQTVTSKDSRDITDQDRSGLARAVRQAPAQNVLVTHGAYSLQETAKYLAGRNTARKTIILSGSMVPLVGFAATDAGFNLGFAVASFAGAVPGVYMCVNGGLFQAGEVCKNTSRLRFE